MSVDEQQLTQLVTGILASDTPFLTELGPLILAACAAEMARDTRSIAREFDVAHALVIRESVHLSDDLGLLVLEDRGDTSGRLFFALSDAGHAVLPVAR